MTMAFHYAKQQLHIEDLPLADIAHRVGTPVYCYSHGQIEANYKAFETALGKALPSTPFTICYACKAGSNIAILRILQKLGAGADIVSGGELARAEKAEIAPQKIVFSGVGKMDTEIEQALKKNILQLNAESMPELENLSTIAGKLGVKARVALRVNPGIEAATHSKISTGKIENKFGIDILDVPEIYGRAAKLPNIEMTGLSLHIGSQIMDLEPFRRAFSKLAALTGVLRSMGHDIKTLDLGGGIGIPYKEETPVSLDAYAQLIADTLAPLGCHIILEPGRLIVGNAGILLSKVLYVKESPVKKFLIIDAAMNDLLRPSMYDAYHPVLPLVAPAKFMKEKIYDVVGPVCESSDTFLRDESLPPLKSGDLIAIMNSGAYGASMSSTYNTRPLVPEILVRGADFAVIRVPQTVSQLLAMETFPGWPGF